MLLVHIPRMTNRLGYTLNVLFRHLLRLDFEITVDLDVFERHDGPKLCYGRQQLGDGLFIRSCDLLFQTTIEDQQPRCFRYEEMPALYPVHNAESAFPFDIFAASFFCLAGDKARLFFSFLYLEEGKDKLLPGRTRTPGRPAGASEAESAHAHCRLRMLNPGRGRG